MHATPKTNKCVSLQQHKYKFYSLLLHCIFRLNTSILSTGLERQSSLKWKFSKPDDSMSRLHSQFTSGIFSSHQLTSCICIIASNCPATKLELSTVLTSQHSFAYIEDCPAIQQQKLSFQRCASRGLSCWRISLVMFLLTLYFSHTTVGHTQVSNKG